MSNKTDYTSRAQTIFRVAKNADNPFVMIDRRVIENPKLSWKAKGLLAYLLSRPDNWVIRFGDLVKRAPDGAHTIRQAMKELKTAGHVKVTTEREGGRITRWVYEVFEVPPHDEIQQVETPQVEKRAFNNTDSPNDTDSKDINTGAGAPEVPASFGIDWQIAGGNETVVIPEETDKFQKDAEQWSHLIGMNNADLEPIALEFMTSANKLPTSDDIKLWRKVFRKFRSMTPPATPDHIRQAVILHTASQLPIKSPLSIEWAVIETINPTPKGKTNGNNQPRYQQPAYTPEDYELAAQIRASRGLS